MTINFNNYKEKIQERLKKPDEFLWAFDPNEKPGTIVAKAFHNFIQNDEGVVVKEDGELYIVSRHFIPELNKEIMLVAKIDEDISSPIEIDEGDILELVEND